MIHKLILAVLLFLLVSCSPENSEGTRTLTQGFVPHYQSETGISFMNKISESEEMNVVNYEYLYNGGGVGIGDFNKDGLPDVFFAGTMVDDKLYINKGSFKFEETALPKIDNGGFSTGVSVIDINNDGLDDIYVSRTGKGKPDSRKNLLYLNKGNLEFEEAAESYGIASNHHTNHTAFFDYDKDGDLDLYILNHPIDFKNSQKIRVEPSLSGGYKRILESKTEFDSDQLYRNNGDMTFTDISDKVGINNYGYGLSVSIIDVNSDSYPDIYVANDYIDADILYVNDGKGGFDRDLDNYFSHISENSMGSDWADLNNDSLEDLIVVDMISEDNYRQKTLVSSMTHERYHTLKNLTYSPQHMRNIVQLNNGAGSFSEIGQLLGVSNTDWSWAPLIVDFDNDGHKDIFISNGYRRDLSDCDYTLYKSDSLSKANVNDIQEYLANIPETPIQNYIFKNKGNLSFEKYSDEWNLTDKTFSNGSAFADLNGDGQLDLIVNNVDTFPIVYENRINPDNKFLKVKLSGSQKNIDAIGSKIVLHSRDASQVVRVATNRGYFSSVSKVAHFGLGINEGEVDSVEIFWPDGMRSVVTELLLDTLNVIDYAKVDKRSASKRTVPDKLLFNRTKGEVNFKHQENVYDDLRTQHLLPHCFSNLGPSLVSSADYTFCGGAFGQPSVVVDGKGKIQQLAMTEATEDLDAAFFDADADGDLDLYVVAGGNAKPLQIENYSDKFYENINGRFQLTQDRIPPSQSSGGAVCCMDYDGDGDMDLFVGGRILPGNYPYAPISYVLENREASFVDVTDSIAPDLKYLGMITDCDWSDIDNDGAEELVIVGEFLPVTIFKYANGKFSDASSSGLEFTQGWWNTVKITDLDGDGDMDILAGNLGLNAKYKCSRDKPYTLYSMDFDNNGRIDPIACQYYGDKSYPIPARGDLLKQLPVLQRRLKNYRKYAVCQIEDLFAESELNKTETLKAFTFSSTAFINDSGTFTAQELPVESQFAPVYAIEVFSYDNRTFVMTAGNNSKAHVESGPYDAGRLVCYEYLKGQFIKIPISKLGILQEGEVRSIVYDEADMSLLIGINDNKVETYKLGKVNF